MRTGREFPLPTGTCHNRSLGDQVMTETINTTNLSPPNPSARAEIAMPPSLRGLVENAINGLLVLLDEIDSDPDLEPSLGEHTPGNLLDGELEYEDEPSLGWTAGIKQEGRNWRGETDDSEDEHDGREPDVADYEPSLGACENHPTAGGYGDQSHWGDSSTTDREDDGDDREPDYDNEPECGI
jgi:hypothetical protein